MYVCNKQNITCPLVYMNFIFSCSTRYLTNERSERVRYGAEHSKIKFISTRRHVISSLTVDSLGVNLRNCFDDTYLVVRIPYFYKTQIIIIIIIIIIIKTLFKSQFILAEHECFTNWGDCKPNKSNQKSNHQIKSNH